MRINIELELISPTQVHSWQQKGYVASGGIDDNTKVMAKVTCPVALQSPKIKTTVLERACLRYLAQGLRSTDIAKQTNKTIGSIDHCISHLRTKLNCQKKNNVALVLKAINMGILDYE